MKAGLNKLPKIKKTKKRIGRGVGSARGSKSGRGMKGQRSRAGYSRRAGFEGGQTPLYQRLPKKRGSKMRQISSATKHIELKITDLAKFAKGDIVGPGALKRFGVSMKKSDRIKLIGSGVLENKLTVRVHAATKTAQAIVEKAGGKVELISRNNENSSK
jgi:large subunit ribosomal protein L15